MNKFINEVWARYDHALITLDDAQIHMLRKDMDHIIWAQEDEDLYCKELDKILQQYEPE